MCDEIINVVDSVSTNVANALLTKVTSTVSINSETKNVRYKMDSWKIKWIVLHMFLLVTILPFKTAIIINHNHNNLLLGKLAYYII